MTKENKGIDHGIGIANVDHNTGIRYGVIPAHEIGQIWYEDSEENYGAMKCSICGDEITIEDEYCPNCKTNLEYDCFIEPASYYIDNGEYSAEQAHGDPDIFIISSPYYTYAQFCSPCAPGACYLLTPLKNKDPENRAYCFHRDWFEEGIAPYPVYEVKTGKLVKP